MIVEGESDRCSYGTGTLGKKPKQLLKEDEGY